MIDRLKWMLVSCLVIGAFGCVSAEQDAVARYAENDMNCGEGAISMEKTAYRTYKVTGCGQERTYSCDSPHSTDQGCSALNP